MFEARLDGRTAKHSRLVRYPDTRSEHACDEADEPRPASEFKDVLALEPTCPRDVASKDLISRGFVASQTEMGERAGTNLARRPCDASASRRGVDCQFYRDGRGGTYANVDNVGEGELDGLIADGGRLDGDDDLRAVLVGASVLA